MKLYKFSEDISVEIPKDFTVTDTLGQKSVRASFEDAFILVSSPTKKINNFAEDKDELVEFYDSFLKGMLDKSKGTLIKKELVNIKGFYFYKFSFKSDIAGDEKIWTNYVLLINEIPYSFLLIGTEDNTETIALFEKQIINSKNINKKLTIKSQFDSDEKKSQAYQIGRFIGSASIYALIGGIILFFVLRGRKKKTN